MAFIFVPNFRQPHVRGCSPHQEKSQAEIDEDERIFQWEMAIQNSPPLYSWEERQQMVREEKRREEERKREFRKKVKAFFLGLLWNIFLILAGLVLMAIGSEIENKKISLFYLVLGAGFLFYWWLSFLSRHRPST